MESALTREEALTVPEPTEYPVRIEPAPMHAATHSYVVMVDGEERPRFMGSWRDCYVVARDLDATIRAERAGEER